jgi:hypothetical protein
MEAQICRSKYQIKKIEENKSFEFFDHTAMMRDQQNFNPVFKVKGQ